ncbi:MULTISPECIES: LysR family transcriptional regulator [Pseudochrobactrum]|jgi:LysR family glycine cleavage system transcriptional activator|uniref:LysR family transcriptional regulator n=2 Tax=Pseudochrobactrum TaxID=354349 RepID=A0A366DXD2_9HYPH|nr:MULTISPECIES: LysR family transcriptional regulator [Pseudochrobactrum]MBX8801563.1 LysR family transcriptional regulator [Ochrobactrum sp. MR28]MBX8816680.1 LysR family transcriptional regulator [Ochrobactrum sp. MR31]MDR2312440.1 LysR family transcriptional regulator [Brucellaceae bacterium]MDM7850969.1 LysR family transcriptional regulator [Pseudochrobactrum kiredjianiae]RBO94733.1 LysR family transcriptional regulator [Pseudochrobactrum asaccharolyticum]
MKLSRRLIPDIAILQAFECAARHGSFTQAAHELNLTQSAVSRQIKDLEGQLGVLLFERIRQRILLSDAGRKFLPEVRRLLNQTEDTMLRAMASAQSSSAFSVATLPTFGARWLMPRIPNFIEENPGVAFNVGSRTGVFDFEEYPFDMAIHYGQPVWAHATCNYLCSEMVVPVASSALIESHRIVEPEDLQKEPLLHLTTRPKMWTQWFEQCEVDARTTYSGHRFDQFSMVIEAAAAGLGIGLLPVYLIEQELQEGRLRILFDKPMRTENDYYLVVPEGKHENPLIQTFSGWIRGQVGQHDYMALVHLNAE